MNLLKRCALATATIASFTANAQMPGPNRIGMKYGHVPLAKAVDDTIQAALTEKNGKGGVIALDKEGNISFGFNTEGMYRGYVKADGKPVVQVYRD